MSVTDDQARAITYLATACRPKGAPRWDEQGIFLNVMKIADRSLPMVIEHVIRHASDAKARTPGVIAGNFTPPAPVTGPPSLNPTPAEACTRCGLFTGHCHCTRENKAATYDDPLPAHPRNPNLDARLEQLLTKDQT